MSESIDIQTATSAIGLALFLLLLILGALATVAFSGKYRRAVLGTFAVLGMVLVAGGVLLTFRTEHRAEAERQLAMQQARIARAVADAQRVQEENWRFARNVQAEADAKGRQIRDDARALAEQTRQRVMQVQQEVLSDAKALHEQYVAPQHPPATDQPTIVDPVGGISSRHVRRSFSVGVLGALGGVALGVLIMAAFARRGGLGAAMFAGLGLACVGLAAIVLLKISAPTTTVRVTEPVMVSDPATAEGFWNATYEDPTIANDTGVNIELTGITSGPPVGDSWGVHAERGIALGLTVLGAYFLLKGSVRRRQRRPVI